MNTENQPERNKLSVGSRFFRATHVPLSFALTILALVTIFIITAFVL